MKRFLGFIMMLSICLCCLMVTANAIYEVGKEYTWEDGQVAHNKENAFFRFKVQEDGTAVITGHCFGGTSTKYTGGYRNKGITIPSNVTWTDTDGTVYTFPVKNVATSAFQTSFYLAWVNYEEGLEIIGDTAFNRAYPMAMTKLPDSLKTIGKRAFGNSAYANYPGNSLTKVAITELPPNLESLGENAFEYCSGIKTLKIPASLKTIPANAFLGCTGLETLTIENGVETISALAFKGCTALKSVTIPASVKSLALDAFPAETEITIDAANPYYAMVDGVLVRKLQYVYTIADGAATITGVAEGEMLSGNCLIPATVTDESGVDIPVTAIGERAFEKATGITGVIISDGVTSIGQYAFSECTGLTAVSMPDTVTTIGKFAFNKCSKLADVTLSNGVTRIEDGVFFGCSKLAQLVLPNQLTYIGNQSFQSSGIVSLDFPATFASWYGNPFNSAPNIVAFNIDADNPTFKSIDGVIFNRDGKTLRLYPCAKNKGGEYIVPDGVTTISGSSFYTTSVGKVVFSEGVESIGDQVFGWSSVTEVVLPNTITSLKANFVHGCSKVVICYHGTEAGLNNIVSGTNDYYTARTKKYLAKVNGEYKDAGASVETAPTPAVKEGYGFSHWADASGNTVTFPYTAVAGDTVSAIYLPDIAEAVIEPDKEVVGYDENGEEKYLYKNVWFGTYTVNLLNRTLTGGTLKFNEKNSFDIDPKVGWGTAEGEGQITFTAAIVGVPDDMSDKGVVTLTFE